MTLQAMSQSLNNRDNTLREQSVQPQTISTFEKFLGSGLLTGYFPFAPGTAGSAMALALYFIPGFELPYVIIPLIIIMLVVGTHIASKMEIIFGRDPSQVTIDEMVGMWISLLFLPKLLMVSLTAFVFFRAYDIVKPFPARKFDRRRGGLGIMLDDVVAGFYANISVHILIWIGFF